MNKRELQNSLGEPYNRENWKQIVQFVFPNVSLLSSPKDYPIDNDKIKQFCQLGTVRLKDGKTLALFELLLDESVNIQRNRVELNNEIYKYIDQEQLHGVLSVFEQGTDDYRFTFSAKSTEFDEGEGDFVNKKTDTKRFTYVLGKNESCKTPADRFFALSENKADANIAIVQDAFSVERLSKEFFDKYKVQFNKFWAYIAANDAYKGLFIADSPEKRELQIRDFTKKLLGRIVFLHFLQKKGWMGCPPEQSDWLNGDKRFMQNLFADCTDKATFHSNCLHQLFYKTLNRKRPNDIFACTGLTDAYANIKIPYLNGGLFDSDEVKSKRIDFPEDYFTELLEFFGQYNFTIDENDPNDHEVGIDPEMLGHIFENLLEDNKDKGAFYTPKVIVQYMCQESLIEYLSTKLSAEPNSATRTAIEELIREQLAQKCGDLDLIREVADALYKVKICDPAIGSGAFPMGILNVICQTVQQLHFIRPGAVSDVWKISADEWQPHLVKKNIIQHSIYGVDIESGAVDIARLRFWLALVVDETEPLPLPNLDYKIMQGNSLLESFEGIDLSQISNAAAYEAKYDKSGQVGLFSGEVNKKVETSLNFDNIKSLMDNYFLATNPDDKKELHKLIDDQVLSHIRFRLDNHRRDVEKELRLNQKKLDEDVSVARTAEQKERLLTASKLAKKIAVLKKDLENYGQKEVKLARLSNSDERPFFLWHLFFQEIFEAGGFDIMIGNPPYIEFKKMPESDKKTFKGYKTATGKYDIFGLFIELTVNLLKVKGVHSFINPTTFLMKDYGKSIRKLVSENFRIIEIMDFADYQIFDSAITYTGIFIYVKELKPVNYSFIYQKLNGSEKASDKNLLFIAKETNKYKASSVISSDKIIANTWIFGSKESEKLMSSLELNRPQLKDLTKYTFVGIQSGKDEVFFVSEQTVLQHSLEMEILHPILKGKDIRKYSMDWSGTYVIYPYYKTSNKVIAEENFKEDFPNIYKYLFDQRHKLKGRTYFDKSNKLWYELWCERSLSKFIEIKIVNAEISPENRFQLDMSGILGNTKIFSTVLKEEWSAYYLTLLAILNSKLLNYYHKKIASPKAGGFFDYKTQFIQKYPISFPKNKFCFDVLSSILIILNEKNLEYKIHDSVPNTHVALSFEEVIDALVFELYFPKEFAEKGIKIEEYAQKLLKPLKDLSEPEQISVIHDTYQILREKNNPLRNQIKLMKIELKELLLPILSV